METQVNYEIQNMDEEIVEKGYVIAETVNDDEPELYIENEQGFYVPELAYTGKIVPIDSYWFWEAVWDHRDGTEYGYEDGEYEVTINPDGE